MDPSILQTSTIDNNQLQLQSPEAIEFQLEIAGIGARSYAFIIDWHIRLLLALSWLFGMGLLLYSWQGIWSVLKNSEGQTAMMILLLPTLLIYFFYHPILEILMAGKTPGKRMAGVRIVTTQGLTPTLGALLLRNIFRLLDSLPGFYILGLLACAVTQHKVRIGDLASGLLLVYDKTVDQQQLRKVTDLAMHSNFDHKDQALLLELLARWQKLNPEDRIRLAEKLLKHLGEPVSADSQSQVLRSTELHNQLQRLTQSQQHN